MSMAPGAMNTKNAFSRNKKEARLEDFERLCLVGKGTFGKVF